MRLQFLVAMFLLSTLLSCSQEPQSSPPAQSSPSIQRSKASLLPVVVAVRIAADGRCLVENSEVACKDVGKTIVAAHPNASPSVAIETEKSGADLSAIIAPVEQSLSAVGIKDITVATVRNEN